MISIIQIKKKNKFVVKKLQLEMTCEKILLTFAKNLK